MGPVGSPRSPSQGQPPTRLVAKAQFFLPFRIGNFQLRVTETQQGVLSMGVPEVLLRSPASLSLFCFPVLAWSQVGRGENYLYVMGDYEHYHVAQRKEYGL